MISVTVVGLVSDTCPECQDLRDELKRKFLEISIILEFVEVSYDDDPQGSIESLADFGISEVPSFYIGGIVFTKYYSSSDFDKAVSNILENVNPETQVKS